MSGKHRLWFEKRGLAFKVRVWLESNPPPKGWQGDEWSWAFTEYPLPVVEVLRSFFR